MHKGVLVGKDVLKLKGIAEWVDRLKGKAGVYSRTSGPYRVYLIAMGECPTGGYMVTIKDIRNEGKRWLVKVVFDEPQPEDIVTQVVTYPHQVVAIPDDGLQVMVWRLNGKSLREHEDLPVIQEAMP
ncbi:MAG TPA: protease complex subunit PrcB family protein [Clostridia bacterium]|nr:protease complex subunit PrcB family protein [Clostridia bacterium]